MQMMHDPPGGRIMHHLHDPPSDALLRFAHSCSFAALSRRPSLRSARGCATRQASPAVSLSLKRQASPAARTLSQLSSPISPGGTINLTESRCGRALFRTHVTDVHTGSYGTTPYACVPG